MPMPKGEGKSTWSIPFVWTPFLLVREIALSWTGRRLAKLQAPSFRRRRTSSSQLKFLISFSLLLAVGWASDNARGFGEQPGVKAQVLNIVHSTRTVMRSKWDYLANNHAVIQGVPTSLEWAHEIYANEASKHFRKICIFAPKNCFLSIFRLTPKWKWLLWSNFSPIY